MNCGCQHLLHPMALIHQTTLKVAPIGRNHSLVAHTSKCGWAIMSWPIAIHIHPNTLGGLHLCATWPCFLSNWRPFVKQIWRSQKWTAHWTRCACWGEWYYHQLHFQDRPMLSSYIEKVPILLIVNEFFNLGNNLSIVHVTKQNIHINN